MKSFITRTFPWAVAIFISYLFYALCSNFGMHFFNAFDYQPLIDSGWRMINGQVPNRDFPCTLPPMFILGSKWAYQLWGVSWHSLCQFNGIAAGLLFLWLWWAIYTDKNYVIHLEFTHMRWSFATLAASAIIASTFCVRGCWWYNSITAVIGCIFVQSSVLLSHKLERKIVIYWLSWVASMILLLMCKPQVAGPLILGVITILLISSKSKITEDKTLFNSVIHGAIVSILWAWVIMDSNNIGVLDTIKAYIGVAHRAASWSDAWRFNGQVWNTIYFIELAAILFPLLLIYKRSINWFKEPYMKLSWLTIFTGLLSFCMNGEHKFVDSSLILFGALILRGDAPLLYEHTNKEGRNILAVKIPGMESAYYRGLCTTITALSLYFGYTRVLSQMQNDGLSFDPPLNYQINVGYFNGLKTGATFAQSLWGANRAVEWVKQQKPNAKIWFGTRLSWMNCAFGIQSQKNTPMWWHPGTAFPKGDTEKYWQLWRDTQYDALITYGADKTWLDDEQLHDITNLYTPNKSLGPIWVWTRSNPAK